MLQFNLLILILSTILLVYQCRMIEGWKYPSIKSDWTDPPIKSGWTSFVRKADFKLSQTYNNVIAITLQCISDGGYQSNSKSAYYADARFTFKQADDMVNGVFRYVYTSQHVSTGTWKTDDNKGIQFSSVSVQSHWNGVKCDVVNVTTNSKSVQRKAITFEHETVTLQCPEDYTVLTISKATFGSNQQSNCTADVQDVLAKRCNSTTNPKTCTFTATHEQLEGDPCPKEVKEIHVDYTCTQPNCVIDIDGVPGNCSKIWNEPLGKPISTILNKVLPIKLSPSSENSTDYEKRITKLEKDQRQAELKIKTQNEVLKENRQLIFDWIIPTLGLICSKTDSPKNQENCIQHNERLMQHAEKSFGTYKKLE